MMENDKSINFLKEHIELINNDYPDVVDYKNALECAIRALEEVQQYRAIGTLEELKTAMQYVQLAKAHGTVGQVIENCAEYEEIGTPKECLRNKDFLDFLADKMNPDDFETYLRIYNALGDRRTNNGKTD